MKKRVKSAEWVEKRIRSNKIFSVAELEVDTGNDKDGRD